MENEASAELIAFGEAIRRARKSSGRSQEEFAEICGLHRTYIGQVERGEKNISFINILRVAKWSGQKPSVLFRDAGL
jgi:transcriptional regulator with XRE-family HTH domain